MSIRPLQNIAELNSLEGKDTPLRLMKRNCYSNKDFLNVLFVGSSSVFVRDQDGVELVIGRYTVLNCFGIEVQDNYAYVNVYWKNGKLIGGDAVSDNRSDADDIALLSRVGCLKVKLEERFDD